MPRIVIIAGEASGDILAAGLIRAVRAQRPDVQFEGIAGPLMREAGCVAWRDSTELSVMGLFEVLRHLPRLLGVLRDTRSRLAEDPPDLLIGVDAPDFNLRIEAFARQRGIATVHYVSPSVWAWRESRVATLRDACDHVLCLLPFEAEFLDRHGVRGHFVGHPLADEIEAVADPATVRDSLGIRAPRVVAMLPGSRGGEVSRLAPVMARTAAWLAQRDPALEFVVPVAAPRLAGSIRDAFARDAEAVPVHLVAGEARQAMAAADVVLIASGTATLEAMLVNRPMVVVYRFAPLTYYLLLGLKLVKVEHFSLPNLMAGRDLVPEFLQSAVVPENLGPAVEFWLNNPAQREEITGEFSQLAASLRRNASEQSARVVLDALVARK
jgi:lipid-A-disaccharide synthase